MNKQELISSVERMESIEISTKNKHFSSLTDVTKYVPKGLVIKLVDQLEEPEVEQPYINEVIKKAKNIVTGVTKQFESMNWFVRKSNGLLYYYKYKPSVVKVGSFLLSEVIVTPVKGDRERLFPEVNNTFMILPKNVVIHREDIGAFVKRDQDGKPDSEVMEEAE